MWVYSKYWWQYYVATQFPKELIFIACAWLNYIYVYNISFGNGIIDKIPQMNANHHRTQRIGWYIIKR